MRTKKELLSLLDEVGKAGYSGLTDYEVCDKLNSETEVTYVDVNNEDVLRELPAMSNPKYNNAFVWDVVNTAAAYNGADPSALAAKDVAARLIFTFESRLPIDMGGVSFEGLSQVAQQVGFFTQEQLAKLKNLGKTLTSRSKILGLGYVTPNDLHDCRKI